jgi:DNA-binding MarR family transcriptional regulator
VVVSIPAGARTRVLYALRRAHQTAEAAKEERLRPLGVTSAHYAVLINLNNRPGLTGAELARLLGVSPQNVTGLVNRLAGRGLVERTADPRHPHVTEIRLTDEGRARLWAADAVVAELESTLVAYLGPEAVEGLRVSLDRLTDPGAFSAG